jgi:hypothetical protein
MAVHAGFRRRNARIRRRLDTGMTVTAVDAVIPNVMLVAELHGLFTRDVLVGRIRGTCERKDSNKCQAPKKGGRKYAESGDEVRATVKNLGHVIFALVLWNAPEESG